MDPRPVAASRVTLSQLMNPGHANILGNVHGGLLMKLCDEAGSMAASKHARRPTVTIAVDSMTFLSPVHIGDLVTVTAQVTWVGRTSLEARVDVMAEDIVRGRQTHTNTAYFVYVALDDEERPAEVPPVRCDTDAERQAHAAAVARQARRLAEREG